MRSAVHAVCILEVVLRIAQVAVGAKFGDERARAPARRAPRDSRVYAVVLLIEVALLKDDQVWLHAAPVDGVEDGGIVTLSVDGEQEERAVGALQDGAQREHGTRIGRM